MNNHLSFASNITNAPIRVACAPLVDLEDIMLQAAMHAAGSGLMNPSKSINAHVLFNAADELSLQRIQNQLNRVNGANKRYWV
jgi:hypothetical protein